MKLSSVISLPVLLLGVSLASAACDSPGFKSKNAKSPADVAAQTPPTGEATTTAAGFGEVTPLAAPAHQAPAVWAPSLTVSDAIAKACAIPPRGDGKAMQASFDFDSAALVDDDRQLLAQVAKCLSDGPLKGRNVSLTGRADPRGEDEYNMTLGESRADSVRRYLIDLGVGKERVRATSRGEIDATGKDEEGWRKDRRVDVELL